MIFYDKEDNRTFVFYTNNLDITAEEVALLYKYRWRVELFFKWLKQHLRVKEFYGTSENAVKIQIYAAIIAYCLVAIIKHDMKLEIETYSSFCRMEHASSADYHWCFERFKRLRQ